MPKNKIRRSDPGAGAVSMALRLECTNNSQKIEEPQKNHHYEKVS